MNLVGRGTRRPGREQNITSPGCPLNRQQWLFGERTINQGPWPARRNHVPLKNNLTYRPAFPAQLLHLVDRGEYVMHQWLWDFFLAAKKGNFFIVGKNSRGLSLFCPVAGTPGGK